MLPAVTRNRPFPLAVAVCLSIGFAIFAAADAIPDQEPSAELLEQGKAVYTDQCQSCHGAEGKGDGPAARFLSPPARDLSAGEFRYAEDGTVEAIAEVIRNGVDDTGMTPFAGQLTEEQITAVANYVVHELVKPGDGGR